MVNGFEEAHVPTRAPINQVHVPDARAMLTRAEMHNVGEFEFIKFSKMKSVVLCFIHACGLVLP